ncbi:protein PIN-LIKES 3-like isoform X1 [Rosa rugosa]|uniref:protein PIN-LIKES 3-like isoform X1 n=1 Tax=Rosa rugosa TaxID=74645 RepID=UPI002B417EA3|nr:protein PIN-LIKES 3-like isoform X1 [Rosa rugosa]
MELWTLFVTASVPVLESFLITALGSYLALDRVNLLGPDCRKYLNTIVFYVNTPALIAANLAETITYDSLVKLWFMPVNILLTFIVGSIFGWILMKLTRTPPHLRGLVLGCCAAGNLGNLLLIIIPAVCEESGSPFGDADTCDTTGTTYASLSMAIGAIYLWTYVYNIVRISSKTSIQDSDSPQTTDSSSTSSHISYTEPLLSIEDNVDQCEPPRNVSEGDAKMTCLGKTKEWMVMVNEKLNLKTVFSPSTIAVIIGFAVGIISPIRNLLIGDDAPLAVIDDTTSLLGDAAIPLLTLIIGGNLVKGLRVGGIQKSILIGILIVKYVAAPLTGILIVKGAVKFGFVSNDPLYLFVLLLQFAVPPAMNLGTITQLFGQGESECSVIMLWTYIFASLSLTFWCAFFLWLVA